MKIIIKWFLVFLVIFIVVGLVVYIKEEKDIRQETMLNQNHPKPKVVPNKHYNNKIIFINLNTHTKDTHTKDTHTKDTHTKDTHTKDTHTKDTHTKDTHTKDTHTKDTHTKDTHTKEKKKLAQDIIFKGNYIKLGFVVGNYSSGDVSLDLTKKSVKVTCPSGFAIFPNIVITDFGSQSETLRCNRQEGCDVFFDMYINGIGFFAQARNEAKNSVISLVKNDKDGVGAICVKKDQIKDWK
ncbi:hypothetical protein fh0823_18810 [Francisella halioticida]|uniref:hypothetical protein n=1 Tax=Francisella halioticida TaxID=549298 RepID=UPI001AF91F6F|nr:hypothetical protein [Francisella halioticida]BCD91742.1 hypothetical protein fh0823_18810 [Francisella halioticida]